MFKLCSQPVQSLSSLSFSYETKILCKFENMADEKMNSSLRDFIFFFYLEDSFGSDLTGGLKQINRILTANFAST